MSEEDHGASASGPGSHATHGANELSPPVGFDPSREMLSVMLDLFENPQFQVAIGGNPNMVDALMERARNAIATARAALAKASDTPPGEPIWVVEWLHEGRHLYVTDQGAAGRAMTDKFADACDFRSRENAEQYHSLWMAGYPGSRVAEHEWMKP